MWRNWLADPGSLKRAGIVGMNRRNIDFIARYNHRKHYPLVDNKLKTKRLAQQAGIAVPELLGVIEHQYQVKSLKEILSDHRQFVIKPAKGSGGKGITVISDREHSLFFKPSEEALTLEYLELHVSNILSGLYSLGGSDDVAMIEAMIRCHPCFEDYSYEGIPDIRVIVFRGYPVMAMLRLATHASDGKANLHQGAIGVGIDLATGRAISAVQHDRPISRHPDTGLTFEQLQIPNWEELLMLASSCYEMTGLGYLGVDLVIDEYHGPLIIELNARPGLAIQIANQGGLMSRLGAIEKLSTVDSCPSKRSEYSINLFGNSVAI